MAAKKLTPAQRKALEWIRAHEPVGMFPAEGPSLSFLKRLEGLGFVERVGREPGRFGFAMYATTDDAKSLLRPSEGGA